MSNEDGPDQSRGRWNAGSGVAIGVGVGAALGVAMGNLAIGIAIGVAVGVAIRVVHEADLFTVDMDGHALGVSDDR